MGDEAGRLEADGKDIQFPDDEEDLNVLHLCLRQIKDSLNLSEYNSYNE